MAKEEITEFSIRLPKSLVERLDKVAKREYRTRNTEILLLIESALKKVQ